MDLMPKRGGCIPMGGADSEWGTPRWVVRLLRTVREDAPPGATHYKLEFGAPQWKAHDQCVMPWTVDYMEMQVGEDRSDCSPPGWRQLL